MYNILGELDTYEIVMDKKSITEKYPVHVGNAVLQYSKLHFIKFVYFLYQHMTPNSFRLCYADTDSIGKHYTLYSVLYII